MSGKFAMAAEQAKRFRDSLGLVFEALDYLATMENPGDLEANIVRLKTQSASLLAEYRRQAKEEIEREMASAVTSAEVKAKNLIEDAEKQKASIIANARGDAKKIITDADAMAAKTIADAKAEGEKLLAKYKQAHAAAQQAMQ